MKKAVSLILSAALILSFFTFMPVSAEKQTRLYNVYGSNMLFQHSEKVILAGEGNEGNVIEGKLIDSENEVIRTGRGTVDKDGKFSVSFDAPAGSYDKYSIEMLCQGTPFAKLENVVFGELWLSSGQSNMQLEMRWSETGKEMLANGQRGSENVRYFYSAPNPEYKGDAQILPAEPQTDIPGCMWFDGTNDKIFDISGVGYFFAEKLQEDIGMPVGLLSGSLGGSSLAAWLPREAVEKDNKAVKKLGNDYIPLSKWKEDGSYNVMSTPFGMYNKKIAPLLNFRPAGMIWYQGESDSGRDYGYYTDLFEVLQQSYTSLFGFKERLMPIICSSIAIFSFGNNNSFQLISSEFADMQTVHPESRAIIPISDIPMTYDINAQTIHPTEKKPVGERMAFSAEGMVYGQDHCYTGAHMISADISGKDITVKFINVGDGLRAADSRIYGFTACGKEGAYIPCDAEIISKDTVKVYCEGIENPVSVAYANGLVNARSNLYSTVNGKLLWPALPGIVNRVRTDRMWNDFGWTECDTDEIWRCETLTTAGFFPIWEGINCEAEISPDDAYKGNGGIRISGNGSFEVSPITEFADVNDNNTVKSFIGFNSDWKSFSKLSFMVRNSGDEEITFSGLEIITGKGKKLYPEISGNDECSCSIPADGEWHRIELDLEKLRFSEKKHLIGATRVYLGEVKDVSFRFEGKNSRLSMDEISFTTSPENVPVLISNSFGPFSLLFNLICRLVSLIMMK